VLPTIVDFQATLTKKNTAYSKKKINRVGVSIIKSRYLFLMSWVYEIQKSIWKRNYKILPLFEQDSRILGELATPACQCARS
jgi:hypothetical protein